jgi:hypothetical protein
VHNTKGQFSVVRVILKYVLWDKVKFLLLVECKHRGSHLVELL